jgi:hypothetical protein
MKTTRKLVVATVLAATMLPAAPAAAHHGSCSMYLYRPWAVHDAAGDTFKVKGPGEARCPAGVEAFFEISLKRHRWWGWETLNRTFVRLREHGGYSGLRSPGYVCDGEGTFTYKVVGELQVRHIGAGGTMGWGYLSGSGPENRIRC